MTFQNQRQILSMPVGRLNMPALLYGSVGLLLSYALHWIGMFKRVDALLLESMSNPFFHEGVAAQPTMLSVMVVAGVFCYGIAFAVLDSPSVWRRVLLGITAMILTVAMVPTFAVWSIYFSPFVQLVGVFWSWFCVVIYTQHHRMPCDSIYSKIDISQPDAELIPPLDQSPEEPNTLTKTDRVLDKTVKVEKGLSLKGKEKPKSQL